MADIKSHDILEQAQDEKSDSTEESRPQEARPYMVTGILDNANGSDCRIRSINDGLVESPDDPFVPQQLLEQYDFRTRQEVTVEVVSKKPRRRRKSGGRKPRPTVQRVCLIEGISPEEFSKRKAFEDLTPISA